MEQFFDDYDDFIRTGSPEPEGFEYIKFHHQQTYQSLEWPVMPVEGDEK